MITGESNALWNRDSYHCVFPGMVKDWQVAWTNRSGSSETLRMPFGFVQLAAGARENATVDRFAQTAKYGYAPNPLMPTAFMAAAYDTYDPLDPVTRRGGIHPRNKRVVARRLALAGLNVAYGRREFPKYGPYPVKFDLFLHGDQRTPSLIVEYDQEVIWDAGGGSASGFYACCGRIPDCDADMDMRLWRRIGAANVAAEDSFKVVIGLVGLCPRLTDLGGVAYMWEDVGVPEGEEAFVRAEDEFQLPGNPWEHEIDWSLPPKSDVEAL